MTKPAAATLLAALLLLSCASAPEEAPVDQAPEAQSAASEAWEEAPASPAPSALAPASAGLFEGAEALAGAGKWKSAYDILLAADPESKDPLILAKRIEIVLAGYLQSEAHRAFALKDLERGESLEALRMQGGEHPRFEFDPPALAAAQAAAGLAHPPALEKALGDYYYDLRLRFEGQTELPEEELLSLGAEAYGKARLAGLFTALSLGNEAELLLRLGEAGSAEAILGQAEALDPASPILAFNHAVAFAMLERPAEALPAIDRALALYEEPARRLEALSLAARLADAAGEGARAEAYLLAAEKEDPENPEPGLYRHLFALSRGDGAAAEAAADSLDRRFPGNPFVVRSLVTTWFQSGAPEGARAYLRRGLAASLDSDEAAGVYGYYLTLVLVELAEDPAGLDEAAAALDEAERRFKLAYPAEHEVFGAILGVREEIGARRQALPPRN